MLQRYLALFSIHDCPAIATAPLSIPERITELYKEHNPSKLDTVTSLLTKYEGHEEELLATIKKKYGVAAAKSHDSDDEPPSVCPRDGQRWYVVRDAPWTADSTAHYDELNTLRLKELQKRARAAGIEEAEVEAACDNEDPTDDDDMSRKNLVTMLLDKEPDPFLEQAASGGGGVGVEKYLKEGSGPATK